MKDYILALDQGTTSSRAMLFDRAGAVCGVAQKEFEQHYPQPGWVEHDPDDLWTSQLEVMTEVVAKAGISWNSVAALGVANQRETTLLWDRATGEPVHNAIVWQDRRTANFVDTLKADGLEPTFQAKTGLVLDTYFSGSKLHWLLEHVPGARERAENGDLAFGTVDSWLVYKLTGGKVHVTDVSNASRTLLFNIHTLAWDAELLGVLNIPAALLPEVKSSAEVVGEAEIPNSSVTLPIAGLAGDQQAATFGQACFAKGQGKNTYGTGAFMVLNTGAEAVASAHKLLTTVAWQTPAGLTYALEGSVFVAGAVVQWLRDGLGIIKTFEEVEGLAASVPDNGGVYFVPAFAGLGAPHWDPYARGAVLGLTRGSTAAHLARAALESVAYQVADIVDAMRADSGVPLDELRVDGGAANNDLLLQFQADLLGVSVVRPEITETTALGAAYLAGLAVGFWSGQDEIAAQWRVAKRFEPGLAAGARATLRDRWNDALSRAKAWAEE
ncbi:glycerol kinase GlpK [soil metagenome]